MDTSLITSTVSKLFPDENSTGLQIIVRRREFLMILSKIKEPLIVVEDVGLVKEKYRYMTLYRGLIVIAKTKQDLSLPEDAEVINAEEIVGLD